MKKITPLIDLGNNRYREKIGLDYDDFEPGMVIEHWPGRTITETDNIWFSLLCLNAHPTHIDNEYARTTEFKKALVNSPLVLSIITGMSVKSFSGQAIANLGWDKVKLPAPVFVGDTLYAESEILSKRHSKSRENNGIVIIRSTGFNQHKETVISFERAFIMPLAKEL